jgi:hypothetical protein
LPHDERDLIFGALAGFVPLHEHTGRFIDGDEVIVFVQYI